MCRPLLLSLFFNFSTALFAQSGDITIATNRFEVNHMFPDTLLHTIGIYGQFDRAIQFNDNQNLQYCFFAGEKSKVQGTDTLHGSINAVNILFDREHYVKLWELEDNIKDGETNIWFWNKYVDFKDYDADGFVEPVIVYGTTGMNGFDDGRVKILIYYKNKKIAIRHQNGTLDRERKTEIDKDLYNLPHPVQAAIKNKIGQIITDGYAVFPAGWEMAFQKKKTLWKE